MEIQKKLTQQPKQNVFLKEAYKLVHKEDPLGLSDYEMAKKIIEVINNKNWIPSDLAQKCTKAIKLEIQYPNKESKEKMLVDVDDFLSS